MRFKAFFLFSFLLVFHFFATPLWASTKSLNGNHYWEFGLSSGSYGEDSYSEFNMASNWFFLRFLNFRNSFFTRSGESDLVGLDSSARLSFSIIERPYVSLFFGPGLRLTETHHSGLFFEGGTYLHVSALIFGLAYKQVELWNPDKDSAGTTKSTSDRNVQFVLGLSF